MEIDLVTVKKTTVFRNRTFRRAFFFLFGFLAAAGPLLSVSFGLPDYTRWADAVLLLLILIVMALQIGIRLRIKVSVVWGGVWLGGYSLICVLSGIANGIALTEIFLGWRSLAQFLLFYILMVWLDFNLNELGYFFVAYLLTMVVHGGLAVQQALAAGNIWGVDNITGGFGRGTANLFGYACALSILVCLMLSIIGGKRWYLLLIVPIGVGWIMASAQGSYLVFALSLLSAVIISPELKRLRRFLPTVCVVALGLLALNQLPSQFQHSLDKVFFGGSLSALTQQSVDDYGNPGRLTLLLGVVEVIAVDPLTLFLGMGTGSVATNLGLGLVNSNFSRIVFRTNAVFVPSSLIQYLAEIGVLGLGFVLIILVSIFGLAWQAYRKAVTPLERAWLMLAVLVAPFFLVASFGEVVWTFRAVAYPFWILAAYATNYHKSRTDLVKRPEIHKGILGLEEDDV